MCHELKLIVKNSFFEAVEADPFAGKTRRLRAQTDSVLDVAPGRCPWSDDSGLSRCSSSKVLQEVMDEVDEMEEYLECDQDLKGCSGRSRSGSYSMEEAAACSETRPRGMRLRTDSGTSAGDWQESQAPAPAFPSYTLAEALGLPDSPQQIAVDSGHGAQQMLVQPTPLQLPYTAAAMPQMLPRAVETMVHCRPVETMVTSAPMLLLLAGNSLPMSIPMASQMVSSASSSDWPQAQVAPMPVNQGLEAAYMFDAAAEAPAKGRRTTVMMRNLPNNYTRQMLLELLDSAGFTGSYDFVYLPVDFKTSAGLGYAFVNLTTPHEGERIRNMLDGFQKWQLPSGKSGKVCRVDWAAPQQGLHAHVMRYRNSAIMHEAVPDEWKPMLFKNGVRVPFPPPTRKLPVPCLRTRPA